MFEGTPERALLFATDTLLTFYALLLVVRGLLAMAHADFYNPLSQTIVRLTEPPLALARKIIPSTGRWDSSCWLLAYLVKVLELFLVAGFQGYSPPAPTLLTVGLIQLGELLVQTYMVSIFIIAVSSWFVSGAQAFANPFLSLLHGIAEPLLEPARRLLPPFGAIDFSALAVLLLLYLTLNALRSLY